jgi:hypothetical protein
MLLDIDCPSPDCNGNPFVAVFAAKDCIGKREIASEKFNDKI